MNNPAYEAGALPDLAIPLYLSAWEGLNLRPSAYQAAAPTNWATGRVGNVAFVVHHLSFEVEDVGFEPTTIRL